MLHLQCDKFWFAGLTGGGFVLKITMLRSEAKGMRSVIAAENMQHKLKKDYGLVFKPIYFPNPEQVN